MGERIVFKRLILAIALFLLSGCTKMHTTDGFVDSESEPMNQDCGNPANIVTEEHEPYAEWRHQAAKEETELSDDKVSGNEKVSFLGDKDDSHTENNATRSDNDKVGPIESKNFNEREGHKEENKDERRETSKAGKRGEVKAVHQEGTVISDQKQDQQQKLPPQETQVSIPQEDTQKEIQEDTQKDMQQYTYKDEQKAKQEVKQEDTQKNNQENKDGSDVIVSRIPAIGDSEQVIIVSVLSASSYKANLCAYEKINGKWEEVFSNIPAVVGRNGVDKQREGDGKSPTGIFSFGTAFGTEKKPMGVKMPYRQTTDHDYWIDDVNSPDYNKWVTYEGDPKERWNSFEKLRIPAYKYAVVINYNVTNIEPGKGSAIFLHIWQGPNKGTSGCTAVSEENMLKILKWLDPNKKPIIIQGTQSWINSLTK